MTSPQMMLGPVFEDAMSLFTDEPPFTKPYRMYATGEGASFGNGEPITRIIETFLQDISVIVIDGYTTRDVTITVWVEADDPRSLQQAEADLMAQLYKPNLLWWQPPHTAAPWAVFEVATSKLVPANLGDTDFDETELRRSYTINLTCGAWVRSKDEEVAGFVDADTEGADVVISSGATLTGVSTNERFGPNALQVLDSGAIKVYSASPTPQAYVMDTVFTGFTFDADTPYLVVDVTTRSTTFTSPLDVSARAVGAGWFGDYWTPVARLPLVGGGFRYCYSPPPTADPAAAYDQVRVTTHFASAGGSVVAYAHLDNVRASSSPTAIGTDRQKMFALNVGGSVEGVGFVDVTHPDDGLGPTLAYTFVDATGEHVPALRPWRTAGETPSADPDAPSGYVEFLGDAADPTEFTVPTATLPDGTYDIVLNAKPDVTGGLTVSWAASLVLNGNVIGEIGAGSALVLGFTPPDDVPAAGDLWYNTIGQITLPAGRLGAASAAAVLLKVWAPDSSSVTLEDGYLLNINVGAYSIVHCGTGAPAVGSVSNELRLLSPTLDWPAPSVLNGVLDDESSLYAPRGELVAAWGRHAFPPGDMRCLLVTGYGAAADAAGVVRYHRRAHTNTDR